MGRPINNNDLFRLAAVLYADNNYEVSPKTIHKKIVESAFIDNGNKELSIDDIISWIEEKYNFLFTEEEIGSIIQDEKHFLLHIIKGEKSVQLTTKRLEVLQSKIQNNNIDYFIQLFIEAKVEYKTFNVKSILHNFLYEIFSVNISSFTKLLDYKKDIGEIKHLEPNKFSDTEKGIINTFLQWENDSKNKAIFDISSYALEYCLITNNSNAHQIHLENLRNKVFYLDTNIIFRALGINGDNRKVRTLTFLKKFNEAKESLVISKFTDSEFKATLSFHIARIGKYLSPKINSSLFRKYNNHSEFFDFYHAWRTNRHNDNLELFEAFILSNYETFKKTFKIFVDYVMYVFKLKWTNS